MQRGRDKTVAYVTLKNSTKLLVVEYCADGQQTIGYVQPVSQSILSVNNTLMLADQKSFLCLRV